MQVADVSGALGANIPTRNYADPKPSAVAETQTVIRQASMSLVHLYQKFQLSVREVKSVSPYGLLALDYIASSTRLSKGQKRALIRLVAIVDEFGGGNPKLMRDIIGIAKIMEMSATHSYKPMPLREALRIYFEEREKLDPSKEITVTVESEINAVSIRYLEMTTEEAVKGAGDVDSIFTFEI